MIRSVKNRIRVAISLNFHVCCAFVFCLDWLIGMLTWRTWLLRRMRVSLSRDINTFTFLCFQFGLWRNRSVRLWSQRSLFTLLSNNGCLVIVWLLFRHRLNSSTTIVTDSVFMFWSCRKFDSFTSDNLLCLLVCCLSRFSFFGERLSAICFDRLQRPDYSVAHRIVITAAYGDERFLHPLQTSDNRFDVFFTDHVFQLSNLVFHRRSTV